MRRPLGDGSSREIGDEEAARDIDDDLHQQHGVVVLAAEEHKTCGQERRIAGQTNPRRMDAVGVGQAEDTCVQPVLRNVAVDEGVAGDVREPEVEDQAQRERRERDQQEEATMQPDHPPERKRRTRRVAVRAGHFANIASGWQADSTLVWQNGEHRRS